MRPLAIPFRGRILGYPMVLRPASGSASFSPTDISGLVAWYDFSDITTLFQDSARTTPVTADADPIGGVTDKSGSANHLAQGTASKRPTYKTGIQNSKSIARSDTTDDVLITPSFNFMSTCTVYAVVKGKATGGSTYLFDNDAAGTTRLILGTTGPTNTPFWYDGSYHEFGTTSATFQVLSWVLPAGTTAEILRNNTSLGTATRSAATATAVFGLLAKPDGANGTGFDLSEFLIYNTAHNATQLSSVFGYCNTKWAVY